MNNGVYDISGLRLIINDGGFVLSGEYSAYCGMGNRHEVDIDIGVSRETHGEYFEGMTETEIAQDMVNWALEEEEWFDPCEPAVL